VSHEYENIRRVVYGEDRATFVPVCEKCFRFVKADKKITLQGDNGPVGPTATCSKCGRTEMIFEGFI